MLIKSHRRWGNFDQLLTKWPLDNHQFVAGRVFNPRRNNCLTTYSSKAYVGSFSINPTKGRCTWDTELQKPYQISSSLQLFQDSTERKKDYLYQSNGTEILGIVYRFLSNSVEDPSNYSDTHSNTNGETFSNVQRVLLSLRAQNLHGKFRCFTQMYTFMYMFRHEWTIRLSVCADLSLQLLQTSNGMTTKERKKNPKLRVHCSSALPARVCVRL